MTTPVSESLPPLVTAGPPPGLFAGTSYSVRAIWGSRELLTLLVRREIKARYKDSSLGLVRTPPIKANFHSAY